MCVDKKMRDIVRLSGAAFNMHDRIDETMMPYLKSIMKD